MAKFRARQFSQPNAASAASQPTQGDPVTDPQNQEQAQDQLQDKTQDQVQENTAGATNDAQGDAAPEQSTGTEQDEATDDVAADAPAGTGVDEHVDGQDAAADVAEGVQEQAPQAPVTASEPSAHAEPAVNADPEVPKTEEEAYLDKLRTDGTECQKRILAAVETFVTRMVPRAEIDPAVGHRYQYEFFKHLTWLLEKDYEEFRGGWNALLVYFALHHGRPSVTQYSALSEFSTNRFMFAWLRGEESCDAYRNLLTLLRATRNKDTRKHDIKTIRLDAVGPNVLSEKALANLKAFYQV